MLQSEVEEEEESACSSTLPIAGKAYEHAHAQMYVEKSKNTREAVQIIKENTSYKSVFL